MVLRPIYDLFLASSQEIVAYLYKIISIMKMIVGKVKDDMDGNLNQQSTSSFYQSSMSSSKSFSEHDQSSIAGCLVPFRFHDELKANQISDSELSSKPLHQLRHHSDRVNIREEKIHIYQPLWQLQQARKHKVELVNQRYLTTKIHGTMDPQGAHSQERLIKFLHCFLFDQDKHHELLASLSASKFVQYLQLVNKSEEKLVEQDLKFSINGSKCDSLVLEVMRNLMGQIRTVTQFSLKIFQKLSKIISQTNQSSTQAPQIKKVKRKLSNSQDMEGVALKEKQNMPYPEQKVNQIDYFLRTKQLVSLYSSFRPQIALLDVTKVHKQTISTVSVYSGGELQCWSCKENPQQLRKKLQGVKLVFAYGINLTDWSWLKNLCSLDQSYIQLVDLFYYFRCFGNFKAPDEIRRNLNIYYPVIMGLQSIKSVLFQKWDQGQLEYHKVLKVISGHNAVCLKYVVEYCHHKIEWIQSGSDESSCMRLWDSQQRLSTKDLIEKETVQLIEGLGLSDQRLKMIYKMYAS